MRILCCGDRWWSDRKFILDILSTLPQDTTIIHGGCRGADRMSGAAAHKLKLNVIVFGAEWGRYGKGAGPIRNEQMINEGLPDKVYAFHDHLSQSEGTRDMIDRAESAGIPVTLFTHKRRPPMD